MALTGYLLLSDFAFLLPIEPGSNACKIKGILLHWLLLVSQMWITIICVDLALAINSFTSVATRNKSKWFQIYFIVALVIPLLFVVPAVILNETGVVDVGYKHTFCWVEDLATRIWSYIVPVALQNLTCLCLLIKTMRRIHVERRANKRTLGSSQQNVDIVKIVLKLAVGLGLVEFIGFIQIVDRKELVLNSLLSILYAVTRSLRGAFVCFLYLCNKRVFNLYKKKKGGYNWSASSRGRSNQNSVALQIN